MPDSPAGPIIPGDLPAPALPARRRRRGLGVGLLLVTSVLWSLSGVAVKLAQMHPLAFTFYRSLAGAAALGLLLPLTRGSRPDPRWMLASLLLFALTVTFLITAMTLGKAAAGILLQYTAPIFCALLAWILQGRRTTRRTLLAMGTAGAGIGVMVAGAPPAQGLLGPLCGLLSGVTFGALILVLEKIERLAGGRANPCTVVFLNNLGTAVLLLPVCLLAGGLAASPHQLAIVLTTGVVQMAIPYVLFQLGLRHLNPVTASLLVMLEPVLNPVWVALFTRERPDLAICVGGAAILTAMVLEVTRPRQGPGT
ncbi:MAG: DMT family transporter [Candidatus Latescibacterota bacterium]